MWTKKVDQDLFNMAIHLGPWLVMLAPALVAGVAFGQAVEPLLGETMARIAGASAALGLEVAGVTGFHVATAYFSRGHHGRSLIAFLGGLLYVGIGIGAVRTIEAESAFRTIGTAIFLLVPLVYGFRGMNLDLERMDQEPARKFLEDEERKDRAMRRSVEKKRSLADIPQMSVNVPEPSVEVPQPKVFVTPATEQLLASLNEGDVVTAAQVIDKTGLGKTVVYEAFKTAHFEAAGRGKYKYVNGGGK